MPSSQNADLDLFGSPEDLPAAPQLQAWTPQDWPVADGWHPLIQDFLQKPQGEALAAFIRQRLDSGAVVYPPTPFHALALTPRAGVRVVILGQDPYHGPGQAQGLAFSVPEDVRVPPSLRNIFKELARDPAIQAPIPNSGSLERWARQGVLLLNTSLTVELAQAGSHARQGWEVLTDALIAAVAAGPEPVVFMLWGAHAQAKQALINPLQHLVLLANHPSPLSALRPPLPFLGCGHFSAANAWLRSRGRKAVEW